MDKMELKALGKINLGLDVLGRRENGYHDVRMVMQTVYLYDQIRIEKTKKPGIELSTNLFYLPVNENNLAYQAADLLMKEFDVKEGVKITLDKHIPVAAGMAGGSSNAAAVLFGINRMFSLGLSQKELMERGVTLGADVPYCVMRGTVLAEGIGEILEEGVQPSHLAAGLGTGFGLDVGIALLTIVGCGGTADTGHLGQMHDVFVHGGNATADDHLEAVAALRHRAEHALHVLETILIDLGCVNQFKAQSSGAMRQTANVFRSADRSDDLRCERVSHPDSFLFPSDGIR